MSAEEVKKAAVAGGVAGDSCLEARPVAGQASQQQAAAVDLTADYSSEPPADPGEDEESESDTHFEIMSYPADTTLKGYKEMYDNKQLTIPPLQRKYVWDQVRASKLIESFLLGLPVPGVFLYKERSGSEYLVIDGQQRIKTIAQFLSGFFFEDNNKKPFKLKAVDAKWDGKSFDDLTDSDQFKLETAIMRATIIQQLEPKDKTSIYSIFERLNTGGVNLNPMEVRMCVSEGNFIKMLSRLNRHPNWRKIYGTPEEHKRSKDKERILRIMALYDKGDEYFASMKRFLNDYISSHKDLSDEKTEEKERLFLKAAAKACFLGDKPFHLKAVLNVSCMESVVCALMKSPVEDESKIKAAYQELRANEEFINLIEKGDTFKAAVAKRLNIAERAFNGE